jgi:YfiR/HmsC-like
MDSVVKFQDILRPLKRLHCRQFTTTLGIVICLVLFPRFLVSQEEQMIRYRTEANYLAHFAYFVEWPSNAFPDDLAPVVLCLVGNEAFGSSVQALTKDSVVQKRKIEVRTLKSIALARSCHILFIGQEESERYGKIFEAVQDLPILTVGESSGFLDSGGAINFVFLKTVEIDVNLKSTNRAQLKMSAKLLSMARRVTNYPKTR